MANNRSEGTAKRYLTGIDWIIHTLDYMTLDSTGIGNSSQVVFELHGTPEDELRNCLSSVIKNYPAVWGHPARNCNLAPYWKMPDPNQLSSHPLNIYQLKDEADAFPILEKCVNTPFKSPHEHTAFHLIYAGNKVFAVMTFDHRLFDARGAEAFLGILNARKHNKIFSLTRSAQLDRWAEKFRAGQQVNRAFLELAKNAPPLVIPLPPRMKNRNFKFEILCFSKKQTSKIVETAYSEAGYLMLMPYLLGITISALHEIFTDRGIRAGDYIIPVNIDMRSPQNVKEEIFFNHMSFLMFRIPAQKADSFPDTLMTVRRQLYTQIKSGLPAAIREVSFLMRIAPLPVLSRLMRIYFKGQTASFSFSYVGETAYPGSRFMGKKIDNLFHMPRVPTPPGLGVFFHQFHGRLRAVVSYLEGMLTSEEADKIRRTLESRLGS